MPVKGALSISSLPDLFNERIGYAPISAITPSLIKTISLQDHMSERFDRSVR
jgi:hypothetical protein